MSGGGVFCFSGPPNMVVFLLVSFQNRENQGYQLKTDSKKRHVHIYICVYIISINWFLAFWEKLIHSGQVWPQLLWT